MLLECNCFWDILVKTAKNTIKPNIPAAFHNYSHSIFFPPSPTMKSLNFPPKSLIHYLLHKQDSWRVTTPISLTTTNPTKRVQICFVIVFILEIFHLSVYDQSTVFQVTSINSFFCVVMYQLYTQQRLYLH